MNTTSEKPGKTLILGLGNEYLGDDAVGILTVRELSRILSDRDDLVFLETNGGGMALLDLITGYGHLILIDAIHTTEGRPGQIYRLCEDDFLPRTTLPSAHHLNLKRILDQGRQYGCPIPEDIVIYAVEVADAWSWHLGCTPPVSQAMAELVGKIRAQLDVQYPSELAASGQEDG